MAAAALSLLSLLALLPSPATANNPPWPLQVSYAGHSNPTVVQLSHNHSEASLLHHLRRDVSSCAAKLSPIVCRPDLNNMAFDMCNAVGGVAATMACAPGTICCTTSNACMFQSSCPASLPATSSNPIMMSSSSSSKANGPSSSSSSSSSTTSTAKGSASSSAKGSSSSSSSSSSANGSSSSKASSSSSSSSSTKPVAPSTTTSGTTTASSTSKTSSSSAAATTSSSSGGSGSFGYCGGSSPLRVGYITSWSQYRTAECSFDVKNLSPSKFTHLIYAFAGASGTTISLSSDDVKYVNQIKAATSVPLMVGIGGWGQDGIFTAVCPSQSSRSAFNTNLLAFLNQYGFAGVDLDWEYPGAGDTACLAAWLQELRAVLGSKYLLTMAIPVSNFDLVNYPLSDMAKYLDWSNVMTYDIHGPWENPSLVGSDTPDNEIYSGMKAIVAQGYPSNKLVLGLALYGRMYRLTSPSTCTNGLGCTYDKNTIVAGPCSQSTTAGILFPPEIEYLKGLSGVMTKEDAWTSSSNTGSGTSWMITKGSGSGTGTFGTLGKSSTGDIVTWDTPADLKVKDGMAKGLCLGGTMVWSVDQVGTHVEYFSW